MKKYSYFLGLLLIATMTVSLTACKKTAIRETDNIEHAPLDRRIGQIESLGGIKTSSQGTHLLKLDDGSAILLKSLNVDLDNQKYRSKIVEVRGLLDYTKDKKQIMDIENIDILEEAAAQQPVIVRWKDYVNPALGFEARYRDDFQIQEEPEQVRFIRQVKSEIPSLEKTAQKTQIETQQKDTFSTQVIKEHIIVVAIKPHTSEQTLLQFLGLENDSMNVLYAAGLTKSKIGTNGLDAYKKETSDKNGVKGKNIYFYIDHNNIFYEIHFAGSENGQVLEDQNVFYDFINSFKLIR